MRHFQSLVLVGLVLMCLGVFGASPVVAAPPSGAQRAYLVGSANPLTAGQVAQLKGAGATVKYAYKNFGGAAVVMPDRAVANVASLPFVTSVGADTVKQLDAAYVEAPVQGPGLTTAGLLSALPGTPYWLDLINAENNTSECSGNPCTGDGVWVAVLDSGFYPNWRDYFDPAKILTDKAMAFIAALGNPNQNQWDVGSDPHGMATAATIVGYRFVDDTNEGGWGTGYATGASGTYDVPGVAPGAKIIPVKVCEPIGCWGSAINAGIDYVTSLKLANTARPIVINESLGGPGLDPVEKAAIDAAIKAGVVIVASAGNSGNAGMGFPAAYEPVISVGAGGWRNQWTSLPDKTWWLDDVPENGVDEVFVANFSSRQLAGQYLDVVSTGRFLLLPYPCAQLYLDGIVTNGTVHRTCASKATPGNAHAAPFQYLFMSGTSFSAPTVAGIVALMLEKAPGVNNGSAYANPLDNQIGNPATWKPGDLEQKLEGSATPILGDAPTIMQRTGVTGTECWEQPACQLEATGFGWVFVDDALAAVP